MNKKIVKPDWELCMEFVPSKPLTNRPYGNGLRPRRMSIHAIAAICERDPLVILDELKNAGPFSPDEKGKIRDDNWAPYKGDWGQVLGYYCPDVDTPIFYLRRLRHLMIDTPTTGCWDAAKATLKKYPFPKFQGFTDHPPYGVAYPFNKGDAAYEKELREYVKANKGKVKKEAA